MTRPHANGITTRSVLVTQPTQKNEKPPRGAALIRNRQGPRIPSFDKWLHELSCGAAKRDHKRVLSDLLVRVLVDTSHQKSIHSSL